MRVGVYIREGQQAADELRRGLLALDHLPVFRRPGVFRSNDIEDFGAVFVLGFRAPGSEIRQAYEAAGIPVVTMDSRWFSTAGRPAPHDGSDIWRLALGGHDWMLPGPRPTDRAESFGIMPSFAPGRRGSSILVCGQVPGDGAHDLHSTEAVQTWATSVLTRIREQVDAKVTWRPHPAAPIAVPGFDEVSTGPIAATLKSSHAVVTISSGAGLDALLAGVPVVALGPCAYSELAREMKHLPKIRPPKKEKVAEFMARLAYQHWTRVELQSGQGVGMFLDLATSPQAESPE